MLAPTLLVVEETLKRLLPGRGVQLLFIGSSHCSNRFCLGIADASRLTGRPAAEPGTATAADPPLSGSTPIQIHQLRPGSQFGIPASRIVS